MNFKFTLFLLFLFSAGIVAQAQNFEGVDFRFAFINNLDSAYNGPPTYYITGEAVDGDAEITITFGEPSDPDYFSDQISVPTGETYSLTYANEFLYPREYGVVQYKSFHIEATAPITVTATYYRLYYSEGSAIMPTSQLSGDYTVVATNYTGSSLDVPQPSLATIVALVDNTEVHYIPSDTLVSGGFPGEEQTVVLNIGETFTLASMYDLTSTRIYTTDNAPIAVFSGHKHTYVGCGADNYLYEQLLPMELWGDHYALIPTGDLGIDKVRIIASEDNTDVFVGCSFLTTLNIGEYFETTLNLPGIYSATGPILPVCFTQGIACNSFGTGDPSMRIPMPLHRANQSVKLRTSFEFEEPPVVDEYYFVHLVTTAENASSVLINGVSVANWTPFNGLPELVYATPEVAPTPNVVEITADSPFWGEYIALGDFDAVAMSLGSDTTMSFPPLQPFFFTLGPDFSMCPGETEVLETDLGLEGTWQDGTVSETYLAQEPGVYTIYIPNPCGTSRDTLVIFPKDVPVIELESTYEICDGDSVLLDPNLANTDAAIWSTGSTSSQIYASQPGWYSLTATSVDGCLEKDSTLLGILPSPDLVVLGPDYFCQGETAVLEAVSNVENLEWSTGETTPEVTVDEGGDYEVVAMSDSGCETQYSFYLQEKYLPYLIVSDSVYCEGSEFQYIPISNDQNVTWPGYSDSDTLVVTEPGVYQVMAVNECGEVTKYVTFETENCACSLDIPNIFSPNGDGKNDLFLTSFECELNQFFQLTIIDRWGNEVFSTSDVNEGWNGGLFNDSSKPVSDGTYYTLVSYDETDTAGAYSRKSESTPLMLVR